MEINTFYQQKAEDFLAALPDNCLDVTITSPPYDKLRTYNGSTSFDMDVIVKELYRTTKDGGIVVWVIGDQTIKGSETGNSFRQVLKFIDAGWNLHDTMIYEKDSISFPEKNRYYQIFEFMFVFSKGKPKTVNLLSDRKNKWYNGKKHIKGHYRNIEGEQVRHNKQNLLKEFGVRFNIWRIPNGHQKSTLDKVAYKHPAIFPERLVNDHILSWSNEGDLICDPFAGSGTTFKMERLNNRNYIGCEPMEAYCEIIKERLN